MDLHSCTPALIRTCVGSSVGAFGFLAHEALRDDDGSVGNYGLRDQTAALDWLQRNVASFGGTNLNIHLHLLTSLRQFFDPYQCQALQTIPCESQ